MFRPRTIRGYDLGEVTSAVWPKDDDPAKRHDPTAAEKKPRARTAKEVDEVDAAFEITGSTGKLYQVERMLSGAYRCNCENWRYRRKDCKHIYAVQNGAGRPIVLPVVEQ